MVGLKGSQAAAVPSALLTVPSPFLSWIFPGREASYLRVPVYPSTPTKTSTSSPNQFRLLETGWPRPRSRSSSSSRPHNRHSRRDRRWAALPLTVSVAPAVPMTAAIGKTPGATSIPPLAWEDPRIQRTERARQWSAWEWTPGWHKHCPVPLSVSIFESYEQSWHI